jgi:hypothetical protein
MWLMMANHNCYQLVWFRKLTCCNYAITMGNVCTSWFIINKVSIDFQFFGKKNCLKFSLSNLGPITSLPTLCNYVTFQRPKCTMHYVVKKSSKFWIIISNLLVVILVPKVWILMNLLFNAHVLCYLVMIVD